VEKLLYISKKKKKKGTHVHVMSSSSGRLWADGDPPSLLASNGFNGLAEAKVAGIPHTGEHPSAAGEVETVSRKAATKL